jgi:hypothetical protein
MAVQERPIAYNEAQVIEISDDENDRKIVVQEQQRSNDFKLNRLSTG